MNIFSAVSIELAKERILEGSQTVSQIAYELGFQYLNTSAKAI